MQFFLLVCRERVREIEREMEEGGIEIENRIFKTLYTFSLRPAIFFCKHFSYTLAVDLALRRNTMSVRLTFPKLDPSYIIFCQEKYFRLKKRNTSKM